MSEKKSVIERLKAYRDAHEGEAELELPRTGVVARWPKFMSHGAWQKALRLAQGDFARAQVLYIVGNVSFDGERLTEADYNSLLPLEDALQLTAAVFGQPEDAEPGEAAGKPAA